MNDARRSDARSKALVFGAGLFVVALLPRLYVALAWAGEPVWDGHYYDFGARRIAAGLGYSDDLVVGGHLVWHPWCHYPVGYSAFLGFFYATIGASPVTAAIVDATTGALLAVVTWLLAREALGERRGRVAGAIVALHPGLILYAALVMTEPLAALGAMLAFWVAVRTREPRRGVVFGALLLGASALVRPQALLCAPFLGLRMEGSWRRRAVAGLAACAIALVPVLPWTARNCRVMDGCALVSTNAGWNLAIGAFPRATGRFETLRSSDGCREVTGQVQQDRCWLAYGEQQIAEHPWHWLALVPAKLGYTFDHESFPVEYLREARPLDWPEVRRVGARGALTAFHRLLVCAAALGGVAFLPLRRKVQRRRRIAQGALLAAVVLLVIVACRADAPTFWPLAVFASIVPALPLPGAPPRPVALVLPLALLATTVVTHAVFFGEDRYHVVVVPVLALLASAAFRRSAPAAQAASATESATTGAAAVVASAIPP